MPESHSSQEKRDTANATEATFVVPVIERIKHDVSHVGTAANHDVAILVAAIERARRVSQDFDPDDQLDHDCDAHVLRRAFNKALGI